MIVHFADRFGEVLMICAMSADAVSSVAAPMLDERALKL
jgi:hypothetical protein